MWTWLNITRYSKLADLETDSDEDLKSPRQQLYRHVSLLRRILPWIIHLILLITSSAFFTVGERIRQQSLGPEYTREYGMKSSQTLYCPC
jgi:hypothetical protein